MQRLCGTESGLCLFPNERHPENLCLLCNTNGDWIPRSRSKLVDDNGDVSLNIMPTIGVPQLNQERGMHPRN